MDPSDYLKALLVANSATQAMQAAVDRVRDVFACDVAWTGLLHEDECLHIGAHAGLRTPEMPGTWRLEVGAGIGGRAAQLGRAHKSNDYQHDARRVPAKRVIDNEGIVAVLVVPILAADRTLGVLYAASRTPRRWSDDQATRLETISHYLAVRLKQLD
ncbi:MAG TPA: GAF domain-containing protein, partial [Brevibacterium sp.]|nr:GAF domain-containing protein [Brevibacterium sp.]